MAGGSLKQWLLAPPNQNDIPAVVEKPASAGSAYAAARTRNQRNPWACKGGARTR